VTPINVQVYDGNVSISTGERSTSQVGPRNVANVAHIEVPPELARLLRTELPAAAAFAAEKTQEHLRPHVQAAQEAAARPHKDSPGMIRRAIDSIKSIGEAIDGGEKILEVCAKLMRALPPDWPLN